MTTSVISVVKDEKVAGQVIDALREEGFNDRDVKILNGIADKLLNELSEHGFGDEDAEGFAKAVENGLTLVAARVPEDKADQAASVMERFEVSPEDQGSETVETREQSVPIVEERLSVGKTKSATGGVRVTSQVTERPVEETVTLTEEHVSAEQRPADRALAPDEADAAFQQKTVEMMGVKEEAEVRKEARVTGEVAVAKETTAREETIRDTVRKTDVDVEEIDAAPKKRK
ncbi:MAG TPA: YsnF/AvaK domain-containing protein [Actinomycetota bacterium]|nr:YsnF/AvaK domain-containing protein [Actinomycetota bacterium]